MRHSSSWPDRAAQTVKMRIDSLSRAFTIIPTSRETIYRLEQTAPLRSNFLEEVVLLDRCVSGGTVTIKRRLIDGRPLISKKFANLTENSIDTETKSVKRSIRRCLPRSLSSTETTAINQNAVIEMERNIFKDQSRCKSDSLVSKIDTDFVKSPPKNIQEYATVTNKFPPENNAFDVIVNIANEKVLASDAVQINDFQKRETNRAMKKRRTTGLPRFTTNPTAASSAPHIEIVNYDDYVTSVSLARKDHHACSKCTSEGVLRTKIDPFCSPLQCKKNNDARDIQRGNSIRREKKETRDELRADKRQIKDIWHEERLVDKVKSADGNGKKLQPRRKNDSLSPARPTTDFRKEATLRRHYYPEGGWGYVIVTCSVLVHFIGVGLQLAAPGCWHSSAKQKFRHPPLHSTGKKIIELLFLYIRYYKITVMIV